MCAGERGCQVSLSRCVILGGDVSPMNQRGLGDLCCGGHLSLIALLFFVLGGRRGVTHHVEGDPEEEPLD